MTPAQDEAQEKLSKAIKLNTFNLILLGATLGGLLFFSPLFLKVISWITIIAFVITLGAMFFLHNLKKLIPLASPICNLFQNCIVVPLIVIEAIVLCILAFFSPVSTTLVVCCMVGTAILQSQAKQDRKVIDVTPR